MRDREHFGGYPVSKRIEARDNHPEKWYVPYSRVLGDSIGTPAAKLPAEDGRKGAEAQAWVLLREERQMPIDSRLR